MRQIPWRMLVRMNPGSREQSQELFVRRTRSDRSQTGTWHVTHLIIVTLQLVLVTHGRPNQGTVFSMSIVIGTVCQKMTRFLSIDILKARTWNSSIDQLYFWNYNLTSKNCRNFVSLFKRHRRCPSESAKDGYVKDKLLHRLESPNVWDFNIVNKFSLVFVCC